MNEKHVSLEVLYWFFYMTDDEAAMTPYDEVSYSKDKDESASLQRPSRDEAEAAVKVLLKWAGDDPSREGLVDTPARVVRSYEEFFAGYAENPEEILTRTFEEIEGYNDMVMLRDISLQSHCEHHMVPILGKAHIAYMPDKRVVGISKLARVLDIFAKRLQTQETMTSQIADTIQNALKPRGVALLIDANHECMSTRGVCKTDVSMITTRFTGVFETNPDLRARFYEHMKLGK